MNQHHSAVAQPAASSEKVNLLDLLIVLAKYKKLLIWMPLSVGVLAAAVAFSLPPVYRASTTLLPPQQSQSGAAALLSQLGGMASMAAGAAGLKNPNDVYTGMLKSRTVADRLIKRYSLMQTYDTSSPELTRKELEANTTINTGKDGLMTIEVDGTDPKLATALANAYVDELMQLTKTLAVTEASQRRFFFEKQLELSKNNLAAAEVALKQGLDTRGVISVDAESRGLLETVGRLRAQVSAKEIELDSLRAFVTEENWNFRRTQEELASLRAELGRLENGRGPAAANEGRATKNGGLDNIKLLRDVKYHQMLYELLARQFEMARLEEARDSSVIQVLDPAQLPERSIKPKRAAIVLISVAIALFLAVALAFLLEVTKGPWRNRVHSEKWNILRSYLRRQGK